MRRRCNAMLLLSTLWTFMSAKVTVAAADASGAVCMRLAMSCTSRVAESDDPCGVGVHVDGETLSVSSQMVRLVQSA